jgi:hypothetical protein
MPMSKARRGCSHRRCPRPRPAHLISAEATLGQDEADAEGLAHALSPLCERLSARLKQASLATGTIILAQDRRFFGWAAAMPAAHDASHLMTLPRREG